MKADLDKEMAARGFDAIVVMGPALENHSLAYMTNQANLLDGIVLKKLGEPEVLICGPMEREEAAKSGLPVKTYSDFHYPQHVRETRSAFEGYLKMMAEIFSYYNVSGTVSFYGLGNPGSSFVLLNRLMNDLPTIRVTGEPEAGIFDKVYATKDSAEFVRLKAVAELTNRVMADTVSYLIGHEVNTNRLTKVDGVPLKIKDVKAFVRQRLLEAGLEAADGLIFAIGRDGAIPHSQGNDDDDLILGQPIVFDLFPRELGGGYFHDMTRTFCLGYASQEIEVLYAHVMEVFDAVASQLKAGEPGRRYQTLACDIFEGYGHRTSRSHPGTEEGYVHSLGHGLGLQIHARPRLSEISDDLLEAGQVFTIEPGLYYPDKGIGIRIEDTYYIDGAGIAHSLTPFPRDLVLAIPGVGT